MLTGTEILGSGFLDYEIFPLMENPGKFCKGNNKRRLCLALVAGNDPELVSFLKKIMKSVSCDVDDDALTISLTSPTPFSFKALDNKHHFNRAVFFGIQPADAGLKLNVQPYQPLEVAGIQYLFCHDLKKIQDDPALKRQLWEALKSMFLK